MEEYCVYPSDEWNRLGQSNHWTVLYLSHSPPPPSEQQLILVTVGDGEQRSGGVC